MDPKNKTSLDRAVFLPVLLIVSCQTFTNSGSSNFIEIKQKAEKGDMQAQNALATLYDEGDVYVKRDPQLSFYWCKKAAQNGHPEAQYKMAMYYRNGEFVKTDFNESYNWYFYCSQNRITSFKSKGLMGLYELCESGQIIDTKKANAYQWATEAALEKDPYGCYILGLWHQRKGFSEVDQKIAEVLFRIGAENGFAKSQLMLGILYLNGKFMHRDQSLAHEWIEKASKQEDQEAAFLLTIPWNTETGAYPKIKIDDWRKTAIENKTIDSSNKLEIVYSYLHRVGNPNS